jgi:hypothetical protein
MRRASALCLVRRIWSAGIYDGEWRWMMMRMRMLKRKKRRSESEVSRAKRRRRRRGGRLVSVGVRV